MADLFGPPPLDQWPEELRVLFYERWAIREFCGGQETEAAKAEALLEVWSERSTK